MRVGMDFGISFVKAYIEDGASKEFLTKPVVDVGDLITDIVTRGVTRVGVAGAGFRRAMTNVRQGLLLPYFVHTPGENRIAAEITTQAKAIQHLMARGTTNTPLPATFLIASIGSAVSYTAVGPNSITKSLFGLPRGGADLQIAAQDHRALFSDADMERLEEISAFPNDVNDDLTCGTADCYLKELDDAFRDTPYIAAHYGNAFRNQTAAELARARWRSKIDTIAVGIVKDLLDSRSLHQAIATVTDDPDAVRTLVAIGGTLEHFPILAKRLRAWCTSAGWQLLIPPHVSFVGAIGAALAMDA